MARYEVEGPDGARYEIEGPDNATADQLGKFIQSQAPAQPKPEKPGFFQSLAIGAGRGSDEIMSGITQLYGRAIGDPSVGRGLDIQKADKDAAYRPFQEQRPVLSAIGEALPDAALLAGGVGPAQLFARGALSGAIPGALKQGTDAERAGRAAYGAVGGALGTGAALGVGRLLRPNAAAVVAAPQAIESASRIGYQPTAGQLTQNRALLGVENYLAAQPGSAGVMSRAANANQEALNTAGARAMGERATDLGETTFANAQSRIGGEYRRLEAATSPDLANGNFLNALQQVEAANTAKGAFASKNVTGLIDKSLDLAASGKLSGEAYKQIRTELSNASQSAFRGGDATTGQAYKAVRDALDEAAGDSLSAADRQAWGEARKQWSAFKTLTKSNVSEGGNVSAARVAAELRRQGPALRTGAADGPLADIARVGESFKTLGNPNSGSMGNQLAYQNVLGPLMMLGNRGLASAYMSRPVQNYMTNGLLSVTPGGRALLGRTGGLLGVPATQGLLGVE